MTTPTKPVRNKTRVEAVSAALHGSAPTLRYGFDGTRASLCAGGRSDEHAPAQFPVIAFDLSRVRTYDWSDEAQRRDSGRNRRSSQMPTSGVVLMDLPFEASIRIDPAGQTRAETPQQTVRLHDSGKGNDTSKSVRVVDPAPAQEMPRPGEGTSESAEGKTIELPDIKFPARVSTSLQDSITGTLSHNGTIKKTGDKPDPGDFGETEAEAISLSNVSVKRSAGNFQVKARVNNPVEYQVDSQDHTNIESENDSNIALVNYQQVVSDLTPNMSDLNGRPPRKQFWAEDLTIRHEQFHANEFLQKGAQGVQDAQTWLNGQTAANVQAARSLLSRVPSRVADVRKRDMTPPGVEMRAYGDGAPLYKARADAIKAKGDAGSYPKTPRMSRAKKVGLGLLIGTALGAGFGSLGGGLGAAIGAGAGLVAGLVGGFLA